MASPAESRNPLSFSTGVTGAFCTASPWPYYCDRWQVSASARFQRRQLLRAPLLLDYFSTTGMTRTPSTGSTVFITPPRPLATALQDFSLDPVEQNIILPHMFLTPIPPKYREAILDMSGR